MSLIASTSIPQIGSERIFTFQSVSRNKEKGESPKNLLEWASQNPTMRIKNVAPSQILSNKGTQVIHFGLSEESAVYFSLLRGMAVAGQPHGVLLKANKAEKDFTLNFLASAETEALDYLSKIIHILEEETRFKQVLRKVIVNQEKFRLEEKLLFHELSK